MIILTTCNFWQDQVVETSEKSDILYNSNGDYFAVEVAGDMSNGVLYVEGRSADNMPWTPLAGVELSSLDLITEGIIAPGIYEFGVSSVRNIRLAFEGASEGISVQGQLLRSENF